LDTELGRDVGEETLDVSDADNLQHIPTVFVGVGNIGVGTGFNHPIDCIT
jgi:hypothetical protein